MLDFQDKLDQALMVMEMPIAIKRDYGHARGQYPKQGAGGWRDPAYKAQQRQYAAAQRVRNQSARDKRVLNHPKTDRTLTQKFSRVGHEWILELTDREDAIDPTPGAITIVLIGPDNEQDPMTPWIVCHRIGHALNSDNQFSNDADMWITTEFDKLMASMVHHFLDDQYEEGEDSGHRILRRKAGLPYSRGILELLHSIFTMRSARNKKLNSTLEVCNELMAQYLHDGRIVLKSPGPEHDQFVEDLEAAFVKLMDAKFDAAVGGVFYDFE